MSKLIANLKALRKKARYSQQALAEVLGVTQQSINQYENHAIEPDISILCDMANFFHVSIDFLVGREYSDEDKTHIITSHISQQEHSLLEKYRALGPSEQKCVDTVVNTLLEKV